MSVVVLHAHDKQLSVVALKQKSWQLKQLQELVGGYIEAIPHTKDEEALWTAFVNEDGVGHALRANPLAFAVLQKLGFTTISILPGAYLGDVIILGPDERGLSVMEVAQVQAIHAELTM